MRNKRKRNISSCGPVEASNLFHIVLRKDSYSHFPPLYFSFIYTPFNVTLTGQRKTKNISLIWSSCSQTVSTSHWVFGHCKDHCSGPAGDPPPSPFGLDNSEWKHQFEKRSPPIQSATGSCKGRERRRDIWPYLLLHGTHNGDFIVYLWLSQNKILKHMNIDEKKKGKMKQNNTNNKLKQSKVVGCSLVIL